MKPQTSPKMCQNADVKDSRKVHGSPGTALDKLQDHREDDQIEHLRRGHSTPSDLNCTNELARGGMGCLPHNEQGGQGGGSGMESAHSVRRQDSSPGPQRRMTGRQLAESSQEGNAIGSRVGLRASARMKDFRMGDAACMRARLEEIRLRLVQEGAAQGGLPVESPLPTVVPVWSGKLRRLFSKLKSTPVPHLSDAERRMLCLVLRDVGGFRWLPFHALMRLARRIQYHHFPRNGLVRDQAAGPWDACVVLLKGEVDYRARGGKATHLTRLSSLAQQHLIMLHDPAQAQVTSGEEEEAARTLDRALGATFATHTARSLHRELALLGLDTLPTESLVAAAPCEVLVVKREALQEVLHQCNCMYIPDLCYNFLAEARVNAQDHSGTKPCVPPDVAEALTEMLQSQFNHLRRNEVEMMVKHLQLFSIATDQVLRWDHSAIECDWLVLEGGAYLLREEGAFMSELSKPTQVLNNHTRPSPRRQSKSSQPVTHSPGRRKNSLHAEQVKNWRSGNHHKAARNNSRQLPQPTKPRLEQVTHPADASDWARRVEMNARRLTTAEEPDANELADLLTSEDSFVSLKSPMLTPEPSLLFSPSDEKEPLPPISLHDSPNILVKERSGPNSNTSGVNNASPTAPKQDAAETAALPPKNADSSTAATEDPTKGQATSRSKLQNRLRRARMNFSATMRQDAEGFVARAGGAADVAALAVLRQVAAREDGGDDVATDLASLTQAPKTSTHTTMSRAAVRRFSCNFDEVLMATKGETFGVHGVRGSTLPAGTVALVRAGAKLLMLPSLKLDKELAMDDEMTKIARVLLIRPDQRTEHDIDLLVRLTLNNKFIQELPKDKMRVMLRSSGFECFPKHSRVNSEGEKGSTFYIILQGEVSIHLRALPPQEGRFATMAQQDPELAEAITKNHLGGCVSILPKGASFGELALMNNKPRAATVFSLQPCFFMTVDKKAYQSVIGKMQMERYEKMAEKLRYIQPLEKVTMSKLQSICVMLQDQRVGRSHVLITEGQPPSNFFIIYQGELKMVRKVPASMRQRGGQSQVPARLKSQTRTSQGLDICKRLSASGSAKNLSPTKVYLPAQVEVGRMHTGEWFGEEVVLGACATQPWTISVESQSGGVYVLEKHYFMNAMTSHVFPNMRRYLEQVAIEKMEKADARFQAVTTNLTSLASSSGNSAYGRERHTYTLPSAETIEYAQPPSCRSSMELQSPTLLEPITQSPRHSLMLEPGISQYNHNQDFSSPLRSVSLPDSRASGSNGAMSILSATTSPEPLARSNTWQCVTPGQRPRPQHHQQPNAISLWSTPPRLSTHHPTLNVAMANSGEQCILAARKNPQACLGTQAALGVVEPHSPAQLEAGSAVTLQGGRTLGFRAGMNVLGPVARQPVASESNFYHAAVSPGSRKHMFGQHASPLSPSVSRKGLQSETMGAMFHRQQHGGRDPKAGIDYKHDTQALRRNLAAEPQARRSVINERPLHLMSSQHNNKICSQGPLFAIGKTRDTSRDISRDVLNPSRNTTLAKLAVNGSRRTRHVAAEDRPIGTSVVQS